MSSESKKKRGESGITKAKNSPFRINGWPPDWQARRRGVYQVPGSHSSGSTTMRGMLGGVLAQALGYRMVGDFDRIMAHAQARCTHPLLTDDDRDEEVTLAKAA